MQLCDKAECTGCGACANICPKQCIKMDYDILGFLMPIINQTECINCGNCRKVCPILMPITHNNYNEPQSVACWVKDEKIRKQSTSGGLFTALSDFVIENGGCVVGCIMSDELNVYHTCVNTKEDALKMKGSKYVQSKINRTYFEVKKNLDEGKYVLFTGTPCQVAGLYGFLGNITNDKLITADIVCHGVGSMKIFKKYVKEKEKLYKSKIVAVDFRNKKHGWDKLTVKLSFENGKQQYISSIRDHYMKAYYFRSIYRDSCYKCKFATLPRVADITIGDYFGIDKKEIEPKEFIKGISVVLINNEKALHIINQIRDKIFFMERPLSESISSNENIVRPSISHKYRTEILNSELPLSGLVPKYCKYGVKTIISFLIGEKLTKMLQRVKKKLKGGKV